MDVGDSVWVGVELAEELAVVVGFGVLVLLVVQLFVGVGLSEEVGETVGVSGPTQPHGIGVPCESKQIGMSWNCARVASMGVVDVHAERIPPPRICA